MGLFAKLFSEVSVNTGVLFLYLMSDLSPQGHLCRLFTRVSVFRVEQLLLENLDFLLVLNFSLLF